MLTSKKKKCLRNYKINFNKIFRVLLRVRMLYYIKHEVIGDYVQQIQDGVPIRYGNAFNNRYFYLSSLYIYTFFIIENLSLDILRSSYQKNTTKVIF